MAIDLSTHSKEITAVYKDIVGGGKTDWLVCGYEGKTNSLKLLESGDDGLEGLQYALSDSMVQYAFARVIDPKSGLPKYVFITYSGDGAPVLRKGQMNSHQLDVKKLLHGYHVEISARSEADCDPALIMEKVQRASGAFYSAHKDHLNQSTRAVSREEPTQPVGSSYQKAPIIPGRAGEVRSKFQTADEDDTQRRIEEERRARGEKDQADRDREAKRAAEAENAAAAKQAKEAEAQRKREADQRAAEARQRELDEQQRREQEEREEEERERQRAAIAEQQAREHAEAERAMLEQQQEEEARRQAEEEQAIAAAEQEEDAAQGEDEQQADEDLGQCAQVLYDYDAADDTELTLREGDTIYRIEKIDDGWSTGQNAEGYVGMFPSNYVKFL